MKGLAKEDWEVKLAAIGNEMRKMGVTAEIVIFGSVPNILRGQPARTTNDLDIWNPSSQFDRSKLARATRKAGLVFDPKDEIEPTRAYLQIVDPGIVQLGGFQPEKVATYGGLRVHRAPAENLIAGKLCRADQQDLEDIAWLIAQHGPQRRAIADIIKTFPHPQKETAIENLVYLDAILATNARSAPPPDKSEREKQRAVAKKAKATMKKFPKTKNKK